MEICVLVWFNLCGEIWIDVLWRRKEIKLDEAGDKRRDSSNKDSSILMLDVENINTREFAL
jgi:hypothetical protein